MWTVPLGRSNGHAVGDASDLRATFNPATGDFDVFAQGLTEGEVAVWFVDNQPGPNRSAMPETGDRTIRFGLTENGRLTDKLDPTELSGFEVDVVVLTTPDGGPETDALASGSPSLFQRLRARESAPAARGAGLPMAALFGRTSEMSLAGLVEEGERLFTQETFGGNGRTCATCHRPENNFTIDPAFIETLPDYDPLFVAETNPALNFEQNGGLRFEHPRMMRQFGLIVANVDGTGDLANKFTLRGVPHTLGMLQSLTADPGDGTTLPPNQRTGWSGDGAPGSGTLRDFATGAVTQHYPLTLGRVPGTDFELPTDTELDAMAAFQLSLGRQEELDLESLVLADADAAAGLAAFTGPGKCNSCHFNAGANFFLGLNANRNFDTGVENFRRPRLPDGETTPPDGGFGKTPRDDGGFGDGTFNTPSLVESADTAPFFHNNSAESLQDAIAFYNTRAFNRSPGGIASGGINIGRDDVRFIARFLRVINAMENIREARSLIARAAAVAPADAGGLLARAVSEIEDAIEVNPVRGGRGRRNASSLDQALGTALLAQDANTRNDVPRRNGDLARALTLLNAASASFVVDALAEGTPPGRDGTDGDGPVNTPPGDGDIRPDDRDGGRRGGGNAPAGRVADAAPLLANDFGVDLQVTDDQPASFGLGAAYPNPFNPTTTISYQLTETGSVELIVYDVLGQQVRTLVSGSQSAGVYTAAWDGSDSAGSAVPSGTYLFRLSMAGLSQTGTMVLLK